MSTINGVYPASINGIPLIQAVNSYAECANYLSGSLMLPAGNVVCRDTRLLWNIGDQYVPEYLVNDPAWTIATQFTASTYDPASPPTGWTNAPGAGGYIAGGLGNEIHVYAPTGVQSYMRYVMGESAAINRAVIVAKMYSSSSYAGLLTYLSGNYAYYYIKAGAAKRYWQTAPAVVASLTEKSTHFIFLSSPVTAESSSYTQLPQQNDALVDGMIHGTGSWIPSANSDTIYLFAGPNTNESITLDHCAIYTRTT